MDIPTISTWEGYKDVGLVYSTNRHITQKEYKEIKADLKRKTIVDVASKFGRSYSTIYNIAKETKCGQNQL